MIFDLIPLKGKIDVCLLGIYDELYFASGEVSLKLPNVTHGTIELDAHAKPCLTDYELGKYKSRVTAEVIFWGGFRSHFPFFYFCGLNLKFFLYL